MVDYAVETYTTTAAAETAIEAIANTVRIFVIPVVEDGRSKIMVITGGTYA